MGDGAQGPRVIDGGYVDAARLAGNAFTVHMTLGTSRGSGDIVPRVELTMSRDFAEYLATALRAALEPAP